jgi:hypothetical protein
MIKNYKEYLFESFLRTSDRLKDVLKKVDDPVSMSLIKLIDTDIKTKFNALDYVKSEDDKKNGKISFLSDSQFNNKMKNLSDFKDLISDDNNLSTVGKISRDILKDNGINFTDKEIDFFAIKFKSLISDKTVEIVKGEDIRYWYSEDNYCDFRGGTLWSSCMRHDRCQRYLDIYVENDNISLLIIKKDEKLIARGLLWDNIDGVSGKKFLDRIYYVSDEYRQKMVNWAKENIENICGSNKQNLTPDFPDQEEPFNVKLKNYSFESYPYMDSFHYSDDSGKFFTSNRYLDEYYTYGDTYGDRESSYESDTGIYSGIHGYHIDEDDAHYSEYYDDYLDVNSDTVVYSEEDNEYYLRRDCVILNTGYYCLKDDAVEVITSDGTCYLNKDSGEFFDYNDEYYHIDIGVYSTCLGQYIPSEYAISLVNTEPNKDTDESVINFIKMVYDTFEDIDIDVANAFGLEHNGVDDYCGRDEYPGFKINVPGVKEGLLLLSEIHKEGVIDDDGYEYISNQITDYINLKPYLFTKYYNIEECGKVWAAVVKNNWEEVLEKCKKSSYSYSVKKTINILINEPDVLYAILTNPLNLNKRIFKNNIDLPSLNILREHIIQMLKNLQDFVIELYKKSYKIDKKGLFPYDESVFTNNVANLSFIKNYFEKLDIIR